MAMTHQFRVPIPKGYRIYEPEFKVSGVSYRKENVLKIMKNNASITFALVPEPRNRHDKNAIKIMGSRKGLLFRINRQLGYVPAKIAAELAADKTPLSTLLFRPKSLWIGDRGGLSLTGDLLAPKPNK